MLTHRFFLSLFLCMSAQLLPSYVSAATSAESSTSVVKASFSDWQLDFKKKALKQGISLPVLERAFSQMTPDPSIIKSDENQPEHVRPVWQYLESAISSWRVARGKALLAEHRRTLDAIENEYQVDRHVLVAIWGLESNFGQQMGDKNIVRSLATLAFQGRRAEFWEQQLIAALRIIQSGDIAPENMRGSWAGAMGQTQFMPTTFLEHAVDFDGDGRRDIWLSTADALASAANYLKRSGWQTEQTWGYEVKLPTLFEYDGADGYQQKTVQEWFNLGVSLRKEKALSKEELSMPASIFLPAGYRGPAFIQLDNFRSILKYNQATSYALAVGLLANSLEGELFSLHRWPQDEVPLTRTERVELQNLLNQLGLAVGKADGIIGANSRKAIREFQLNHDQPADGYPSARLLEKVREVSNEQ
ncbi:MAG: lytic murein transglycosylase [Thiopseudomonas sp.]|nr:lytic murein transglycosylase [Thiopseudomonas sp.]MCK9465800.1 lytic murein transglycosylase [Thiopseudomonas sp.]